MEKTTMRTRYNSYEFLVMPFGLCNASLIFTTLMNLIFHVKLYEFMIIYINDILVYSKLTKEHMTHLKFVLQKLKKTNYILIRQRMNSQIERWTFWDMCCLGPG